MKEPAGPEFDRYAKRYTDLHRDSIRASGEDPDYFASYKAGYMAARLVSAAPGGSMAMLDFGCGVGNSISHLRRAFPAVGLHGADLSGESIRLATQAHADEASFEVIEGRHLPYSDDTFDVVMAACVFHHISPDERAYWMSELGRVLKPGGSLFVFEHNVLNPLTVRAVRDCPFDEDAILLPRRELLGLVHGAGFKDVTSRYIVFFPHALRMFRALEGKMGWIPLGAQYVVQATAP